VIAKVEWGFWMLWIGASIPVNHQPNMTLFNGLVTGIFLDFDDRQKKEDSIVFLFQHFILSDNKHGSLTAQNHWSECFLRLAGCCHT
jgi:hypothetical protein